MTPAELRKVGENFYGKRWQMKLAKALPVSARSIRYWLKGVHQINARTARQIRALLPEK